MKPIALITGATGGLGKELAKIHAQTGGSLVLVGRSDDKLNDVKKELEDKYQVQVMTICVNLADSDAADEIYRQVKEADVEIDYLVNNAGFGGRGSFHTRTMDQDMEMLRVNVVTPTKLMKLFLPDFVSRGKGKVLNVSSTASLMPGPLQAEYYATKAYLTSLGNAVWLELQKTPGIDVTVTTLMPGGMNTGFIQASNLQKTKLFATAGDPAVVAKAGYEAMLKGDRNVISGIDSEEFLAQLTALLPNETLMDYVYEMQLETP